MAALRQASGLLEWTPSCTVHLGLARVSHPSGSSSFPGQNFQDDDRNASTPCCGGCSISQLCPILCDPTPRSAESQASLSFTVSRSLLKLMFIESVMPSNQLILCYSLLLLPSIFPSIRVFSMIQFLASGIGVPCIILLPKY